MNNERIKKISERMREEGLEQLLISSPSSLFYLTGKWIHPGERLVVLKLTSKGDAVLIANRLFALAGNYDGELIEYDDIQDSIEVLSHQLSNGKTGIEKTWPSCFTLRLMEAKPDIGITIGSGIIEEARLCKDELEIDHMKESSRKNDQAVLATISRLKKDMLEMDAANIYLEEIRNHGGTGPSFEPLVCFGKNCAEPHHSSDYATRLSTGDSVIIDVGMVYDNYCSDMTRTVFFGNPTDEQKRVYDIVRKANEAGRAAVRPGVPVSDVDKAARKVIEDAGYGRFFIHRTGHGIGLEVHEYPDISQNSGEICRPGMCFSVEPGIYLPGKFGVRIEDLVTVTEDGALTMNQVPRDMLVL